MATITSAISMLSWRRRLRRIDHCILLTFSVFARGDVKYGCHVTAKAACLNVTFALKRALLDARASNVKRHGLTLLIGVILIYRQFSRIEERLDPLEEEEETSP